MIQTYPNYLDQTHVIGFGIPIGWHGPHIEIIPVTPPCRITNIPAEDRTVTIPYENRTVTITCQ